MIQNLFGFPMYKVHVDPKEYEKNKILSSIERNYKINSRRNKWSALDAGFIRSNMHHSKDDEDNIKYEKPDYKSLLLVYKKHIEKYLASFNFKEKTRFNFSIVNYTCMSKGQHMQAHTHGNCAFSGTHYLSFDKEANDSTLFHNGSGASPYISVIQPNLYNRCDRGDMLNSWIFEHWKIPTSEDDLILFPSTLEHSIPEVVSDKLRVTIIINIDILDGV